MHKRAMRLAALAVTFFVLSASSCSTSQLFSGSGLPQLQFVGDSITVQSTADINAHYGSAYDVGMDRDGWRRYLHHGGRHRPGAGPRELPAIEVIELGTNDAAHIVSPPSYDPTVTVNEVTGRLDTFASEFPASTCVIFVTVNTHTAPQWGPEYATQIDAHMRSTYPHIADWDADWQASYFDVAGGVHPNETGRQALLAVEDQAIAGCAN